MGLLKRNGRSFVLLIRPKMGCYDEKLCEKIEVFDPRFRTSEASPCEVESLWSVAWICFLTISRNIRQ